MIEATWGLIVFIIGIALFFDYTNGFHDSANSISTVVSTKVLSPRNAVAFAAFFNFIAAFAFTVAVASTISKIIQLEVVPTEIVPYIILSALIGAVTWNIITWLFGLPTSSSHALIGGLTGAGISAAGLAAIKWSAVELIVTFIVISPIIGLACGFQASAPTEAELMTKIAAHAKTAHKMDPIPPDVMVKVKAAIKK